ncbi:putative leucine-rich repeat-containing protein DDB_G0290503 [Mytilus edulis]|uniref:putative leucine-rich repeat-containing protein DDB_G0290503 n=1 Tax=Mytilus edulis TaxID=6550 RepID=UPI0039F020DF
MAANVDIEKQFLRLIMFCHKISLPVVRTFFVSIVLGCPDYNDDISTFLEHHKHEIFHLVGDYKCCQCANHPSLQTLKFRLGNDQFKKLYDVGLSQPGHFLKGSGGRVFQQCLCCVSVRKDTNPKNYDISLLFAILYICAPLSCLSENSVSLLDTIRKSRNRLCHLNDINDLSEIEIHTLWGNLERSVTMLAGEIPSHPYYKESIEQHVDTFKYTDYNREAITPVLESMRSEIKNDINEVIQNQMISQEKIRCLTNHVEQLSQNYKKDNHNMLNHVAESVKTSVDLHQDAVYQLSAQVDKCHTEEVELIRNQNKTVIELFEKVSGTMEHGIDKLNFLVDIAIDNKKFQHSQNDSILPKSRKSNERSTTQEEKNSEEQDKKRCKLHWRIETPGYLEHKKDEIVKAMKNAIEIVKIGTSHEIEDIHEGSITIDTLLPMSILKDKNAFHQSIQKFLEEMVSVCGIDPKIPLVVTVQITLCDLDQGSVKYSIEEVKHTSMTDKAIQAVPTMLDRSTGSSELEIKEDSDSTKKPEDENVEKLKFLLKPYEEIPSRDLKSAEDGESVFSLMKKYGLLSLTKTDVLIDVLIHVNLKPCTTLIETFNQQNKEALSTFNQQINEASSIQKEAIQFPIVYEL